MDDTELQKLKEIYTSADLDSEDYEDNLKLITSWENSLRESDDFINWQKSDVTKSIARQAKDSYKDNAMRLIRDRELTDAQRQSIWAKQDAAMWILSVVERDVKGVLTQIRAEIRRALSAQ